MRLCFKFHTSPGYHSQSVLHRLPPSSTPPPWCRARPAVGRDSWGCWPASSRPPCRRPVRHQSSSPRQRLRRQIRQHQATTTFLPAWGPGAARHYQPSPAPGIHQEAGAQVAGPHASCASCGEGSLWGCLTHDVAAAPPSLPCELAQAMGWGRATRASTCLHHPGRGGVRGWAHPGAPGGETEEVVSCRLEGLPSPRRYLGTWGEPLRCPHHPPEV